MVALSNPCVCPTCGSVVGSGQLPDQEEITEVIARLDVTVAQAVLFLMLWRARGRVVTYDAFLDLQQSVSGREGSNYRAVASTKKKLARQIEGLPVEIKSVYGLGYRLRKLDQNWDWRQEAYR